MMEVLEHEQSFYTLSRDEKTGEYFFEVECGTTAVFLIAIKLRANEIAKYKADPTSIQTLAYRILDAPDEYLSRKI